MEGCDLVDWPVVGVCAHLEINISVSGPDGGQRACHGVKVTGGSGGQQRVERRPGHGGDAADDAKVYKAHTPAGPALLILKHQQVPRMPAWAQHELPKPAAHSART